MNTLAQDPRLAAASPHAGDSEPAASITDPPDGDAGGRPTLTPYGRTIARALASARWVTGHSLDVHNGIEWVRYHRLIGGMWTSRPFADETPWEIEYDPTILAGLEALYTAR